VYEKVATLATPVQRVTSLPLAPVNGQQVVLTDSLTASTYNWWLIYNSASSSSYKWEFIGGSPKTATNYATGDAQTTANTWQILTNSPTLTVPRAGDYWVRAFEGLTNNTGAVCAAYMAVALNNVAATHGTEPGTYFAATAAADGNLYHHQLRTLAANDILTMCHWTTSGAGTGMLRGGSSGIRGRGIEVVPVRLS